MERKTTQRTTGIRGGDWLALVKTMQALRKATGGTETGKKMVADENEEYGSQENGQETVAILIFTKQGKRKEKCQKGEKQKEKR